MPRTIETRTTVRAPVALARRALDDHVIEVFDGRHRAGSPPRSFDAVITVELGSGTEVRQTVDVHAGRVHETDNGELIMAVRWVAERERVCPSFAGELRVLAGEGRRTLELAGTYQVPLGGLGLVGDATAGRRIAQLSLDRLVVDLARRLDRTVDAFVPGGTHAVPELDVDLRDRPATWHPTET
jgi:hypothetical protein